MTRNSGILSLAVSLLLGGCASDNMTWRDTAGTAQPMNGSAVLPSGYIPLPDNSQSPAVNEKTRQTTHALTESDILFIRSAQAGGMYEVAAGQKALFKSNNSDIKMIAQHMIDDHSKAGRQLANLASRKGLPDNAYLTPPLVEKLARLDSLNGTDFNREYLMQQRDAHQDTVANFELASTSANDSDLRDWTSACLPTFRSHLTMVQDQARMTLDTVPTTPMVTPPATQPVINNNLPGNADLPNGIPAR